MMMKKRIVSVLAGIALIAAVLGTSTGVANMLVASSTSGGQVIACNTGGSSGGGC
jgi:hypothetical protein